MKNGNGNGNGNRNGNGNGNGNGTWTGTNGNPKAIVCSSPLFGQLGSRINAAVTFMERDTIVRTGRLRFSPLPPPPPSPRLALRLLFRLRVRLRLSLDSGRVASCSPFKGLIGRSIVPLDLLADYSLSRGRECQVRPDHGFGFSTHRPTSYDSGAVDHGHDHTGSVL